MLPGNLVGNLVGFSFSSLLSIILIYVLLALPFNIASLDMVGNCPRPRSHDHNRHQPAVCFFLSSLLPLPSALRPLSSDASFGTPPSLLVVLGLSIWTPSTDIYAWLRKTNATIISMYREPLLSIDHTGVAADEPSTHLLSPCQLKPISPSGSEAERRISSFAQSLTTEIPRPIPVNAMPTFAVLTPHYCEKVSCLTPFHLSECAEPFLSDLTFALRDP